MQAGGWIGAGQWKIDAANAIVACVTRAVLTTMLRRRLQQDRMQNTLRALDAVRLESSQRPLAPVILQWIYDSRLAARGAGSPFCLTIFNVNAVGARSARTCYSGRDGRHAECRGANRPVAQQVGA